MNNEVIDFSNPTNTWRSSNPEINLVIQKYIQHLPVTILTSGSTGNPKEITFSHHQMITSASIALSALPFNPKSALLAIPPNKAGGLMLIYRSMLARLKLTIVNPSLNPFEFLHSDIPEIASFTPMQISKILSSDQSSERFNHLKFVWIGGAPICSSLEMQILKTQVLCFETFGMTETASHFALRKIGTKDFFALKGFIISSDNETRLCIQHPIICPNSIITNDSITLTSETSFIWKGRLDFVINSGGVKIHPEIIEDILSPLIHAPFVLSSVDSEVSGEIPVLVVHSQYLEIPDLKDLLPKYSYPKLLFYLPEFPLTQGNKTDRIKIRNAVKNMFSSNQYVEL